MLVHHIEVFHCEVNPGERVAAYNGPCHAETLPEHLQSCKQVIGAWAMGAKVKKYFIYTFYPVTFDTTRKRVVLF